MEQAIYRFFQNYGRHGDIEGKFVATPDEVAAALGREVHFEEPWGKHSGADTTLSAEQFTVVSSDPADVAAFVRLKMWSGENPLAILADEDMDAAAP
jgi:hypothetical protein